jgi:hypothetical protein
LFGIGAILGPSDFCPGRKLLIVNEIALESRFHGSNDILVLQGAPHNQEFPESGIRETLLLE